MSQIKSLKLVYVLPLILLIVNFCLVIVFPSKPPKVLDVEFFESMVNPKISVLFSEQMDELSILDGGFVLTPPVKGNFSWSGNRLFFTPLDSFDFDTEYKLQITSAVKSKRGLYIGEMVNFSIKTSPRRLIYLNDNFNLEIYDFSLNESSVIDENLGRVIDFDYNSTSGKVVVLSDGSEEYNDEIYVLDLKSLKIDRLDDLSDSGYKIHYLKWVPFEDKLLLSRTKIEFTSGANIVARTSAEPEDTDLIEYDLDNGDFRQLVAGNTLFYEFFPSPDGYKVAYINGNGALILKSLDDADEEVLIASQFNDYFGFSELGDFILYLVYKDGSVYERITSLILQDVDGNKQVVDLGRGDFSVEDVVMNSGNDQLFVVTLDEYGEYRLLLFDLLNGGMEVLFEGPNVINDLNLSADDKYLAFLIEEDDEKKIYLYDFSLNKLVDLEIFGEKIYWVN